jgi:hypothetical protein
MHQLVITLDKIVKYKNNSNSSKKEDDILQPSLVGPHTEQTNSSSSNNKVKKIVKTIEESQTQSFMKSQPLISTKTIEELQPQSSMKSTSPVSPNNVKLLLNDSAQKQLLLNDIKNISAQLNKFIELIYDETNQKFFYYFFSSQTPEKEIKKGRLIIKKYINDNFTNTFIKDLNKYEYNDELFNIFIESFNDDHIDLNVFLGYLLTTPDQNIVSIEKIDNNNKPTKIKYIVNNEQIETIGKKIALFVLKFSILLYIKNIINNNNNETNFINELVFYILNNVKILIDILIKCPFDEEMVYSINKNNNNKTKNNSLVNNYLDNLNNNLKDRANSPFYLPRFDPSFKFKNQLDKEKITNSDDNNIFLTEIDKIIDKFSQKVTEDEIPLLQFMLLFNEKYYDSFDIDDHVEKKNREINTLYINGLKTIINKLYSFINETIDNSIISSPLASAITSATSGGNIVKRKTRKHRNL